jgi:hypothetical protein
LGQRSLENDAEVHDVQPVLDLLFENSQRNVYAGELDVRPPAAPTTKLAERAGSAISTPTLCQRCVLL